jgi:hypothetical protein
MLDSDLPDLEVVARPDEDAVVPRTGPGERHLGLSSAGHATDLRGGNGFTVLGR